MISTNWSMSWIVHYPSRCASHYNVTMGRSEEGDRLVSSLDACCSTARRLCKSGRIGGRSTKNTSRRHQVITSKLHRKLLVEVHRVRHHKPQILSGVKSSLTDKTPNLLELSKKPTPIQGGFLSRETGVETTSRSISHLDPSGNGVRSSFLAETTTASMSLLGHGQHSWQWWQMMLAAKRSLWMTTRES